MYESSDWRVSPMTTKSQAVSFRLDNDLKPTVQKWLKQHPALSMSRLANLAIRGYVLEDQVLTGVKTIKATPKEVNTTLNKLMKKHKKTLDELK
jgi:hypothetical protein